jgi:SRSO17 transposase
MLSQLRANNIKVKQVFSSQVSYSPLILTLTQKKDRRNLIIANSIGKSDDRLIAYSELLNSDIVYNWVNYSSLVGLDYFVTNNKSGLVSDRVDNNQVDFNIELMRANGSKFELYIP